jgi:hypothetical protein
MTKGPQQFEAGRILASTDGAIGKAGAGKVLSINRGGHEARRPPDPQFEKTELLDVVAFLEDFEHELSDALSVFAPDPYVRMTLHLIRSHLEAKTVTPTSLIGASGVPYYFGGSYMAAQSIPPLQVLAEPLRLAGGVRVLVHGDPTFMVMDNLKRQFEQVVGTDIHQRAFSIDRLHEEALRNAERKASRYDIIAVDLPWIGEFAEKGVLMPLDEAWTSTAGSGRFPHRRLEGRALGRTPLWRPCQTTPELLFYRKDIFAEAGMEPPQRRRTCSRRQNRCMTRRRGFTASPGMRRAAPRSATHS